MVDLQRLRTQGLISVLVHVKRAKQVHPIKGFRWDILRAAGENKFLEQEMP